MAWKYNCVVWISVLYAVLSLEANGETSQNFRSEQSNVTSLHKIFQNISSWFGEPVDIPQECMNSTVCEDVPNYPEDLARQIVDRLERMNLMHIFTRDVLPTRKIPGEGGISDETDPLCESEEKLVYPRAAQTEDKKWHFIINPKGRQLQGFRAEKCVNSVEGSSCNPALVTFQTGYTGRCIQKYILRQMVAFGFGKNVTHVVQPFKVHSCCSCAVTSDLG